MALKRIAHSYHRDEVNIVEISEEEPSVLATLGEVPAGKTYFYQVSFEAKVLEDLGPTTLTFGPADFWNGEQADGITTGTYTLVTLSATGIYDAETEVELTTWLEGGTSPSGRVRRIRTVTHVLEY